MAKRSKSFHGVDVPAFEALPAGPVEAAGDDVEKVGEPLTEGAGRVLAHSGTADADRSWCQGEATGHIDDLFHRDFAPSRESAEVRVASQLANVVEARDLRAILLVLPALLEDDFDHREEERPVLTRPDGDVGIRFLRRRCPQRIDDDQVGPVRLPGQDPPPAVRHILEPVHSAHGRVHPDKQEAVRRVDVGHHGHDLASVEGFTDDVAGVLVDRTDVEAVVRSDGVEQAVEKQNVGGGEPGWVPPVRADRIRSMRVADRGELLGDPIDRLLPSDLDVPIADPSHGSDDPARMLHEFARRPGLGAEVPPRIRVLLVGGDPLDAVVVADRHLDPAGRDADPAEGRHRLGHHAPLGMTVISVLPSSVTVTDPRPASLVMNSAPVCLTW